MFCIYKEGTRALLIFYRHEHALFAIHAYMLFYVVWQAHVAEQVGQNVAALACSATPATSKPPNYQRDQHWSWERIVKGDKRIVANGNVFPPSSTERWTDGLVLITGNRVMYCPSNSDEKTYRTVLLRTTKHESGAFVGAFTAPGTEGRRLWLLDARQGHDIIVELDTVDGDILQELEIRGTEDGHDVVRIDDRIFMVDSKHGHVVEFELPASAAPYFESSMEAGATEVGEKGYVTVVKRHTGFTQEDHVNNVAVHPDILVASLHAGKILRTRHSALSRSLSEAGGRELTLEKDGFSPVTNMGNMCHGIAFWKDEATSNVQLISLDSKSGSLASVVVSSPINNNVGQHKVLWEPDLGHPVLIPPEGLAKTHSKGPGAFSKGLAVQGGVAFFGVSCARPRPLRRAVSDVLLVAVDLVTGKEKWVRTVRTNGLVNQILTESSLGWQVQLQKVVSTAEL
jgi:hypothetical protein